MFILLLLVTNLNVFFFFFSPCILCLCFSVFCRASCHCAVLSLQHWSVSIIPPASHGVPASKTNRSLRKEQTSEQELGKNWIPTWQSKKSSVLERKNLCAAKPVFLASDSPLFFSGNFSCETQTWNPRAGRRREKLGLVEADEKHEQPTFCCHCSHLHSRYLFWRRKLFFL